MRKIDKKDLPSKLFGETRKTYRLRVVEWVMSQVDKVTYDDVSDILRDIVPEERVTKESIVRDLKVLSERGLVQWDFDPEDGRRVVWSPVVV